MTTVRWEPFPCDALECRGLAWVDENLPDLWRLPRRLASCLPEGVRRQLRFPAGARLRMRSDTSQLHLRIRRTAAGSAAGLDVYVDGRFWGTASVPEGTEGEVACFADAGREPKEITVYLPLRNELQIAAHGIDGDAGCGKPESFTRERPFVLYGSSIAQGIGAERPGMSYAAILGRSVNADYVNLAFGGAGKAEAEVIACVTQIDACCYLLDLGKSYGSQTGEAYAAMLTTLRQERPGTPVICITPVFSSREFYSAPYVDLSRHVRSIVRESVAQHAAQGDDLVILVEGEALLSPQDSDALCSDGVHPSDLGHSRIAERLRPIIEKALRVAGTRRDFLPA
ncbi:SGNH/GDSL hydrolase family protein [Verrucomicrobiota bacterium]